jgi:hypothetical protein
MVVAKGTAARLNIFSAISVPALFWVEIVDRRCIKTKKCVSDERIVPIDRDDITYI